MKKLAAMLLVLFSINVYAQIYVKQEKNGDIIYSDIPMEDAKLLNLPADKPTMAEATTTTDEKKPGQAPADEVSTPYKTFRIISPLDQDTLQNQQNIVFNMKVEPDLKNGDKIQLFIDGKRFGEPSASPQINSGLVERGAHEVYGLIIDKNKRNVMQSNVITIYVMRAHTGAPQSLPKKVSTKDANNLATLLHNP